MPQIEYVVLVDESDNSIGKLEKSKVHGKETPLHRGFSLFLFTNDGKLLLQQRSLKKITWPGVWSNSCCGHPAPNEKYIEAALRRSRFEIGVEPENMISASPYRYTYTRDGVMENEICPIFVAKFDGKTTTHPKEVEAVKLILWEDFLSEIQTMNKYSEWCVDEANILKNSDIFKKWWAENIG